MLGNPVKFLLILVLNSEQLITPFCFASKISREERERGGGERERERERGREGGREGERERELKNKSFRLQKLQFMFSKNLLNNYSFAKLLISRNKCKASFMYIYKAWSTHKETETQKE